MLKIKLCILLKIICIVIFSYSNSSVLFASDNTNSHLRNVLVTSRIAVKSDIERLEFVANIQSFENELETRARKLGYHVDDETRFVLLIGDNVLESSYYKIFTHAFQKQGLNIVYLSYNTFPNDLEEKMKFLRYSNRLLGYSITTPHKLAVMKYMDELDTEAQVVGAVNSVLKTEEGKLIGYTFDGAGWVYWYTKYLNKSLKEKKMVVLGAGGAARSLIVAVLQTAPDMRIVVYDIETDIANALVQDVKNWNPDFDISVPALFVDTHIREADIVANFTGLGKKDPKDMPDIDYSLMHGKVAVDANYRPVAKNGFLRSAEQGGATIYNGLGFLIGTILPFFEVLTGEQTDFNTLMDFAKVELGLQEANGAKGIAIDIYPEARWGL